MATIKIISQGVLVEEIKDAKHVSVDSSSSVALTDIKYTPKGARTQRYLSTNCGFVVEGEVGE